MASALEAAPQAHFSHLSVERGLSQITVQVVLQDHIGFLWFGTEEGLNRFDGYGFAVFKHDTRNPGSLPDDMVTALYEDREQRLWVGTGRGLSWFDRRTETFIPVSSVRERVSAIVGDLVGDVVVPWIDRRADRPRDRRHRRRARRAPPRSG